MKKHMMLQKVAILQIVPAFVVFFLFTSFTLSFTGNNDYVPINYFPTDSIPTEIESIIGTSCVNCHTTGGKALAMSKLNLSEWNEYDRQKQSKKAKAMCEEISEGHMPPKNYIKDHPEAVLSQEQIDVVCKWANQSGK